jgi:hypothetical protein
MNISDALDQYRNICGDVFKRYTAKLNKSFKIVFIETILLYMVIPRKINFTQLGRYGKHCEQCFRQNFTKEFDWLSYNLLMSEKIFGKHDRKAIAIDPSYISKSGKLTPWIGYFWSGCAGQVKRGLEIMGIGLIDIDKHDCMMLKAVQSPDTVTLTSRGVTLNDWYLKVIELFKEQLLSVSKYIVADAYFSKYSFAQGLQDLGFHLVSRLRDDSNLLYLYKGEKTGMKGRPKTFDGKIDVSDLDYRRMEKIDIYEEEGELYTLIAHSKALKRNIRLVIWITPKGAHKLYFSTDTEMSGKDVIQFYRTRFQVEFCFRDSKQFTGLCHSQARNIKRLDFAFNASMTAVNAAKIMMKENGIPFSINTLKNLMYNSFILNRFFELSGIKPNRKINDKLVKELIDIATYRAA